MRFTRWLRANVDAVVALLIAVTAGILRLLNVLGAESVNSAILIVLALLAATLLKDRLAASKLLADASAVRQLSSAEVSQEHAEAHRHTEQWIFKGGTGTYLRAVTLKECIKHARKEHRPLRMRLEIIDPTNETLCTAYAQFRSALAAGPDGTGEIWTFERTRKEAFATILAACWYRQRFPFLTIEVGLSEMMTTFRWDLSSDNVIMTQDDQSSPALMFAKGKPYYRAYSRELEASFRQARRVDLERAIGLQLSTEPTIDETRKLFTMLELDLPRSFTDSDVSDVIAKAIQAKNPYR
ncbi:MAG: hypothetical protein JO063_05265 [Pseudonocardiales bacterium]|nr:hypothetical protein [Pseudonocardiales bacterium]MBV9032155.1 hypothetical protein [Pseudonocardiales bacterium]MBW0009516.1 hypothetical protein [Pseudonocardiales bacterium]